MWILKNSKDLLENIQSETLSSCNNIKTFDFSTLYTSIPYSKLKDKLIERVGIAFFHKKRMAKVDTSILSQGGLTPTL